MAVTRAELIGRVNELVARVRGGLDAPTPHVVGEAIDRAIIRLSRLSPLRASDTLSGDGSAYSFALSGLDPAWIDGISAVLSVEYPTGDQLPTFVDDNEWMLYPEAGNPTHLRFLATTPASGTDNIRVNYLALHTVTTSSTCNAIEDAALEYFGACEVAYIYAAQYAQTTDPTIDADSVDYRSKSSEWAELGDKFCAKGKEALGLDSGGGAGSGSDASKQKVAGAWGDIDTNTIYGGYVFRSKGER